MKTYYQILGVSEKAEDREIKKAFRKIAKENHPDTHPGDKAAEDRFKEANEAYEILSDEAKRREYDLKLHQAPAQKKTAKKSQSAGGPVDFGSMNFGDMFEGMFQEMQQQEASKGNKSAKQKEAEKDPLNMDAVFAKFMGFKP